jgi:fructose-1-phosphate kinase PfkB-like protein
MSKVLVVSLNPTFQKTYMFKHFYLGEVNRESFHVDDVSGKGINAARILTQKNVNNSILTHLAHKDEEKMLEFAKKDKLNLVYALDNKSRVRTCSTLLCEDGLTTELVEESNAVSETTDSKIRELFLKEIAKCDYMLITGTRSPNYKDDIYSYFVKTAKSLNTTVVLDIAKEELKRCLQYKPDIIKPNLSEFMKTFYNQDILENDASEGFREKVFIKVKQLFQDLNITSIITRGTKPIWVFDNNGFYEVAVEKCEKCVNTIGCGDTLSASLIANLIENKTLKQALINASADAKLNAMCIRPGSLY